MLQSIAALDFAGVFLLIGGLFLINFSEKIVKSDKNKSFMSDEEIKHRIRFFRVVGNIFVGIFLVWIIVQFVDIHFFG